MASKKKNPIDVQVRFATAADYDAILDINRNVYLGYDYLPTMYFYFLHHPDILLWVAEHKGKILGFSGFWLMEDRTYACGISARTHPDYKGYGIMDKIDQTKERYLQNTLPHGFYRIATAVYQHKLHSPDVLKNAKSYVAREWNHMGYHEILASIVNERLPAFNKSLGKYPTSFSMEKTIKLLKNPATLEILRKDGDFVPCYVSWIPIKVTPRNMESIAKGHSIIFFTIEGEQCTAVSFCSEIPLANNCFKTDIFYYGENDVTTFVSHVCAYLRHLEKTVGQKKAYNLTCHFPKDMNAYTAEAILQPVLGDRYQGELYFEETRTVCLHRKVKIMPLAKL